MLKRISSGNGLNMYSNRMVHGSISTEGKNSTREGSREDCEVKCMDDGPRLLYMTNDLEGVLGGGGLNKSIDFN
jgi:hypothetical protein